MDLSLNKDVLPSLRSAMLQLRDAGFDASVSGGPTQSAPNNPYGLSVRVASGDPRVWWNKHLTNATPFVAGLSPRQAQMTSPVGFSFNIRDSGDFMLHSGPITTAYEAMTFVKQFTSPVGPEGKIANVARPVGDSINANVALRALARLRTKSVANKSGAQSPR